MDSLATHAGEGGGQHIADGAIQPVILAGGSGTRLWPLSRKTRPKPLLPLLSERTLLQDTVRRTMNGGEHGVFAPPVVVCNESHQALAAEQLAAIGVSPRIIVTEPVGRNTAPALAVTALLLMATDPEVVLLVQPSDHVIPDGAAFRRAILRGHLAATQGWLVTFGLAPERPEPGYGYMVPGAALNGIEGVYGVRRFVEKPPVDEAVRLIDEEHALWNSGIFLLSARRYLEELESARPDILHSCAEAVASATRDNGTFRLDLRTFGAVPSLSIDHAVMERTDRATVVPLDTRWNDVGTWRTLREECARDANGNVLVGDVVVEGVRNSYLRAEEGLVAAVGLDDVIVVSTGDAVLVAGMDEAANVGKLVERMNGDVRCETVRHTAVHRPWGQFRTIGCGSRYQVKEIVVKPGGRLSLQLHHHRAEHWIVVAGTARVVCGDEERTVYENESLYIAVGTQHRLENPGKIPLRVIEVQCGSYLGEDDIVRVEDIYGRA